MLVHVGSCQSYRVRFSQPVQPSAAVALLTADPYPVPGQSGTPAAPAVYAVPMWRALAFASPGIVAWGTHLYVRYVWGPTLDGMPATAAAGLLLLPVAFVLGVGCVVGSIMAAVHCARLSQRIAVAAFNASFPIWLTILLGPGIWSIWFEPGPDRDPPPPTTTGAPYDRAK